MAEHVASRFKLRADIGGIIFEDVVSIAATFGLNAIPSATLLVASGKEYTRNPEGELATIHKNRGKLENRMKAKVELEIINTDGDLEMMDAGKYVIFEGYLAGIGFKRAYDSVSYTLHLIHWLDDLNNSSMINGNWFPGAPYDLAQNAAYYALESPTGEGGGAGLISATPTIDPTFKIINIGNITGDLWGKVFQPILTGIANWPSPRYQNEKKQTNDAAIAALKRFTPESSKVAHTPLALNLSGISSVNVPYAVREAITKDGVESFAYTTIWNKLVGEYAPQFYFAISPGTEHAQAIPFFAGLKEEYKLITSREYDYSDFNANMAQIIESVDIFYPAPAYAGFANGGTTPKGASFGLPLGFYPEQGAQDKKGLKLLKEPPNWLTNIVPFASMAPWTTGVSAKPPGDTAYPRFGPSSPPPQNLEAEPALGEINNSGAMKRFAEHWYKTEVLYQRHGEMSGKLRFDIAPGSIIKIETPPYDLDSEEFDILFATVTHVSYVINGEKATAGTSFMLAHIRTEKENNMTEKFTADKPPLYNEKWKGGPLAVKQ